MPFLPVIGQWFEFMHPPAAYFAYLLAVVAAFIGDYRTGEAGLLCSHGARKWTAGKCENRVRFWSSAGPVLKLTEHSEIREVLASLAESWVVWHLRKLFAWDMEHSVDCCQATMVPCPRRAP